MFKFFKQVKYFLFIRFRSQAERIPWKMLNLNLTAPSGINLCIKNRSDWHIYNEIFVRGDYDFAIQLALNKINSETKTVRFFDLGANVGFFSLKFIDELIKYDKTHAQPDGILVEGSLPVYNELEKRFADQPFIKSNVHLIYGIAGKKEGVAKIFESGNSMTNSITSASSLRRKLSGRKVSYVNLDKFFETDPIIDLLKCDIEGSEQELLENYPSLLKKVNVCVFELHHRKCDTNKCIEIIESCGMNKRKTIFNYGGDTSLEVFWRE
jgi:FkbM family methyltransferase